MSDDLSYCKIKKFYLLSWTTFGLVDLLVNYTVHLIYCGLIIDVDVD